MKKINKAMLFTTTLIMMVLCLCLGAGAVSDVIVDSGECGAEGNNVTWVLYDDGELVISGEGKMESYDGDDTVDGNVVSPWYWDENIKKITIENGVTSIGDNAFNSCYNLKNATISESVTNIGQYAFFGCQELTNIMIPDNVVNIGLRAFCSCHNLTDVLIGRGVASIGKYAFNFCTRLENIIVDKNNINYFSMDGALFDKNNLELIQYPIGNTNVSFEIPNGITVICDEAFSCCRNLKNIIIPDSVITINRAAFSDCDSLESIIIPDSVTNIGDSAFGYCDKLENITLGKEVTSIGEYAFYECRWLTDVYFDGTAEQWNSISIGSNNDPLLNATIHFNESVCSHTDSDEDGNCDNCGEIFVVNEGECGAEGDNVTWKLHSNGELVISGEGEMKDYNTEFDITPFNAYKDEIESVIISDGVTKIGKEAFWYCWSITSLNIPNSVKVIDESAFAGLHIIKKIIIPKSVEEIGDYAFGACRSLEFISVEDGSLFFSNDENGVLFDKEKKKIVKCPENIQVENYEVPDTVKTIGYYAFGWCRNIKSIIIPNTVSDIGEAAFCGSKIEYINIPLSLEKISRYTFSQCSEIRNIIIPEGIKNIEVAALTSCESLIKIELPKSLEEIEFDAFRGCDNLKEIYYNGEKSKWNLISIAENNEPLYNAKIYFLSEKVNLEETFDITFEKGMLSITGSGEIPSFDETTDYPWNKYASSTTELLLNGVTSVGANAFSNFKNLKLIIIDGDKTVVDANAFDNCPNIELVATYADLEIDDDTLLNNKVKFFNKATKTVNRNSNTFSFGSKVAQVNGETSLTEEEFFYLITILYYGFEEDFQRIKFEKLTAEDFTIYKYRELDPFLYNETKVVENAEVSIIIEVDEDAYMEFSIKEFCDGMVDSGEDAETIFKIATPDDDVSFGQSIIDTFAVWFAAIKRAIEKVVEAIVGQWRNN